MAQRVPFFVAELGSGVDPFLYSALDRKGAVPRHSWQDFVEIREFGGDRRASRRQRETSRIETHLVE
jgi:hypothetical protein